MNWLTDRAKWLVPAGVAFCLALLAFDLVAFWAFGRRPLVSSDETSWLLWALMIGSAVTYAARWKIAGEARMRVSLAAALATMVLVSATHPWLNGWGRDAAQPVAPTLLENPQTRAHEALVFAGGPLSEPEASRW
ncbi:MAG: hypothetical protein M5U25_08770 [Planctomycetota bacterium]|nr:hypothetical protein [Planctomycetota bacterium]